MTIKQVAGQQSASVIIGFREESWPKGHGYLYWRADQQSAEVRVCDCNLFDLSPEVVRPMFDKVLRQILSRLNLECRNVDSLSVTFENMSQLSLELFDQARHRLFSQ